MLTVLRGTLLFTAISQLHASEQEKTDLFRAGEGGYASYRIPALTVTPQQTILVACEARKAASGDWNHVDLLMRRSEDGGRTWRAPEPLVTQADVPPGLQRNPAAVAAGLGKDGVYTINNPTWLPDPASGETHLVYCIEYSRAFLRTTRDGGKTFSAQREITAAFEAFRTRDNYNWRVIATGPGHGVRLATGRLAIAVWLSTGEGGHAHRPSVCATIYSDDRGKTWRAGNIVARHPELPNPSESVLAEISPGRVMMGIRSESPRNRRVFAWSSDAATGWSKPAFDEALIEPVCMAGLTAAPSSSASPATLIFSNPASLEPRQGAAPDVAGRVRKNLTTRASVDGGKTWPHEHVLEPGPSAYSDLAVGQQGEVYCLYERGRGGPYETLTFARFAIPTLNIVTP